MPDSDTVERWTMPVSICRVCDKGRDPLDTPDESCGHDAETHRVTVEVPMVPAAALERAEGAATRAYRALSNINFPAHATGTAGYYAREAFDILRSALSTTEGDDE